VPVASQCHVRSAPRNVAQPSREDLSARTDSSAAVRPPSGSVAAPPARALANILGAQPPLLVLPGAPRCPSLRFPILRVKKPRPLATSKCTPDGAWLPPIFGISGLAVGAPIVASQRSSHKLPASALE
jgi:hypothetical protein